eukprot:s876_g3.t1
MTAVGDFRSGCVDLVLEIKCLSWAMHFNLMLSVNSGILPPVCEAIQDSSPPTLQRQRSWLTACQATGFHLNDEVPQISGRRNIHSFNLLDLNMMYGAEPLLDGAQFGSARGRVAEDEQFDYEALVAGWMQMQKMGIPEAFQRNNPFGSGYAGPMYVAAWFFKWLQLNPDYQEESSTLLDAVKMWASSIGTNMGNTIKRLQARLGVVSESQLTFAPSADRKLYGE